MPYVIEYNHSNSTSDQMKRNVGFNEKVFLELETFRCFLNKYDDCYAIEAYVTT